MRHNKRRLRKRNAHLSDLSMTPLIDVALTLLVIFMLATPMLHNAIKITLPRGNTQEDKQTQQTHELIVFIDKNGDFYIDKIKIEKKDLINQIKKSIGNEEKTVYVQADTAVSYGTVVELVDDIKFVGGIKYVALATQKHAQTTPSLG